jgi:putative ABC transport system ATP-binding protein
LLSDLNREGTTIVMVTHSERDSSYAHRIIHLLDGRIVTEEMKGNVDVVYRDKEEI